MREYGIHLWWWLRRFPIPGYEMHTWTGVLGEPGMDCLMCNAHDDDDDGRDLERDRAINDAWSEFSEQQGLDAFD